MCRLVVPLLAVPLCRGLFFIASHFAFPFWGVSRFFFVRMVFPIAFPLCRFSLFDYLSSLSLPFSYFSLCGLSFQLLLLSVPVSSSSSLQSIC